MPFIPAGGHRSNQGNQNDVYHIDWKYVESIFGDQGQLLSTPSGRNAQAFLNIALPELSNEHIQRLASLDSKFTVAAKPAGGPYSIFTPEISIALLIGLAVLLFLLK